MPHKFHLYLILKRPGLSKSLMPSSRRCGQLFYFKRGPVLTALSTAVCWSFVGEICSLYYANYFQWQVQHVDTCEWLKVFFSFYVK